MNGQIFAGREISVVVAAESRKRPEDMRRKTRQRSGGPRYGGRRSPGYRRSRSRSVSRSRSPNIRSSSKGGHRSRSYSPSPKRRDEYSASPSRRPADHPRSPRDSPRGEDVRRSYSPDQEDRKLNMKVRKNKGAEIPLGVCQGHHLAQDLDLQRHHLHEVDDLLG
ncbi:Serine/arginine-rich SC35-like splicing factor SCL30 [Bienertia sinuspersici]